MSIKIDLLGTGEPVLYGPGLQHPSDRTPEAASREERAREIDIELPEGSDPGPDQLDQFFEIAKIVHFNGADERSYFIIIN